MRWVGSVWMKRMARGKSVGGYLNRVRLLTILIGLLLVGIARADQILLVPLDSRPASGQFAQWIGRIGGAEVRMPPYQTLGRFTSPGQPDAILDWLEAQPIEKLDALVVSTDMIAYGGLIESRVNSVPLGVAKARLNRLVKLRERAPNLQIFAFSAVMRLAPTATREAASWRMQLARLVELEDQSRQTGDPALREKIRNATKMVPEAEVRRYRATRKRNHELQGHLLYLAKKGELDYLILGQDDAREYGPHVSETNALRQAVSKNNLNARVFFCEGIDQHSNILISRAMLRAANWAPRVRIVFSDPSTMNQIALYESKPIRKSLEDQIFAAGARPATGDGLYDYSLFINSPNPRASSFEIFSTILSQEIDLGQPVAVADINLGASGVADPRLFQILTERNRAEKLLSYAGWNTAGNTLGTAIPAANIAAMSHKFGKPSVENEVARCEFLLHRMVNDFAYHRYTRPAAYQLIAELPGASKEETTGSSLSAVNNFVQRDLARFLGEYFRDMFFGTKIDASDGAYTISTLDDVKVWLPWPRAYEVRLDFKLRATKN